jgi:hypothetical protein
MRLATVADFADEKDCVLCSHLQTYQREAFRATLDTIPLGDDEICDECLMAWWRNAVLPVCDTDEPPDDPTKH